MANLASSADVEERLDRDLTSGDFIRLEKLLADASAAVRVYTGQDFSAAERTVRLRVRGSAVTLSQRPVTEVASVTDIDGNDVPYRWDGLDRVYLWPAPYFDGFERDIPTCFPAVVDVTYTGGVSAVPDAIKAVVVQMAARAFGKPADDSGMSSETIAGYSYAIGAAAAAGGVGMMLDERAVLDRYRRVGGVAWVGP